MLLDLESGGCICSCIYTSPINMVMGDAIIGCNFLSFLLIKSIFRCREKLSKL